MAGSVVARLDNPSLSPVCLRQYSSSVPKDSTQSSGAEGFSSGEEQICYKYKGGSRTGVTGIHT